MAIAVALTTQCPYCIEVHSNKTREMGASDQEISEVVMIAAALRAGAAIPMVHTPLREPEGHSRSHGAASECARTMTVLPHSMKRPMSCALVVLLASVAHSEILAMLNYESKPEQTIRKEGLAIIDVDPKSSGFGKILMEIPLPSDLVAHHLYDNRDMSKAYVTALGKSVLHVLDLKRFPYRMKVVETPDCRV